MLKAQMSHIVVLICHNCMYEPQAVGLRHNMGLTCCIHEPVLYLYPFIQGLLYTMLSSIYSDGVIGFTTS